MATTPEWQKPPTYHCAYNPVLFIAELNTQDIETVVLYIYDQNYNKLFQTLSAETYEGYARFDVSSVVRMAFNRQLSGAASPGLDRALYFRYRVQDASGANLGSFIALNAVAQVGESPDMGTWLNAPLTLFQRLYRYDGYELLVTTLTSTGVRRAAITGNTAAGSLPVVDVCTPENPFYVRWINMQGGVDYYMFSRRQDFEQSVKQVSTYELVVDDISSARTNSRPYALTAENRVTVGADSIPAADYAVLRMLPFSPSIEWYNETLGKWIALTPAKFTGKLRTKDATHSLEVQFDLPRLNTQF